MLKGTPVKERDIHWHKRHMRRLAKDAMPAKIVTQVASKPIEEMRTIETKQIAKDEKVKKTLFQRFLEKIKSPIHALHSSKFKN